MTALAAVAILLTFAAWTRPRPATRNGRSVEQAGRVRRQRTASPTVNEWAALLDAMSNEIRTGSSLATALQHALTRCRPNGQLLTPSATLATIEATTSTADADEAVVLQALRAAHALGGPTAATLDAASALLRERAVIRGEALAYSAQARLSARVLTGVPLVFAGWSALSSRTFRVALVSPIGLTSAAVGGACNLLGWWWMRRIVSKAVA